MINLFLVQLKWELLEAGWSNHYGYYKEADDALISITKRYLDYVSEDEEIEDGEHPEQEDKGK